GHDVDTRCPQAVHLPGVVGEEAHRPDAQRPQDGGRVAVVAGVHGQAQREVGVDRVGPPVLLHVGPQLVHQADAPALVAGRVDEDAAPRGRDGAQAELQLDAAVAAQRTQRVAGEALRVDPGDDAVAAVEVALHQCEVHRARRALEGLCLEEARRRGQGDADQAARRASTGIPPSEGHSQQDRGVPADEDVIDTSARALVFEAPRRVGIRRVEVPPPGDDAVLVRTLWSGISAGTEMLAYRGEIDPALPLDETIGSLAGSFEFPFHYGYSCVGRVEAAGG